MAECSASRERACLCLCSFRVQFRSIHLHQGDNGAIVGKVKALAGNYPPIVKAAVNLAGAIAKQRHTGLSWDELAGTVARTDLEMAKAALTRLGAAGPSLVSVVAFTRALVDNNWPAIQLIARELVQRRELDHDEFTAC
jgi:hypothetical protein